MIPQPKSELIQPLENIMKSTLIWLSLGILVALIVSYLLTNKITKPISVLMKRTREVDAGYDFIKLGPLPKNSPQEINQLWRSISTLLSSLQKSNKEVKRLNVSLNRDIDKATTELRKMNKHLYEVSSKDYLTALANRRYFTSYLERVLNQEEEESIGIILIDIDKFKHINDIYGHEAGDLALLHVSNILRKTIRKNDLVARFGGDEFVVYIKDCTDKTLATVAESIRHYVEESPVTLDEKTIALTLSIGTVNFHNKKDITFEQCLGFADKAMYISKQKGRNQVSAYTFEISGSCNEVLA